MPKVDILGVFVDQINARGLKELCSRLLSDGTLPHQVVTVNPEFVMEAQKNVLFRDVLNGAAVALADGVGERNDVGAQALGGNGPGGHGSSQRPRASWRSSER
ncbi:MAG: hypothetical protein AAB855_04395, partial [Patescibacteria group bacterium]